ncbi:MAG: EamA family transporter [Deltaproteobacteria bacterium]|nr:EamA family transporter [Deltaproteobacteria bacterium]
MDERANMAAYAALSGAVVFWGLSFVATKVALETIPTFTLIFFRFGLAGLLFMVVSAARGGLPRLTRRAHFKLFLMAVFEPGLYFYFETVGLQHTTAPKAALIIATVPVAVLVFARVLIGERIRLFSLIGILVSPAGIGVLITGDPRFRWALGNHLVGDLLIIGAVVTAALYMVGARDLGRDYSAWDITCFQILYGALFYAPMFLVEMSGMDWTAVSGSSLLAAVYLTVFATVVAFLCYNYGLTRIQASRASVFINGIPVVTAVAAWAVLGERLTVLQAWGGGMVLFGVWMANALGRPGRRRASAAAAERS